MAAPRTALGPPLTASGPPPRTAACSFPCTDSSSRARLSAMLTLQMGHVYCHTGADRFWADDGKCEAAKFGDCPSFGCGHRPHRREEHGSCLWPPPQGLHRAAVSLLRICFWHERNIMRVGHIPGGCAEHGGGYVHTIACGPQDGATVFSAESAA